MTIMGYAVAVTAVGANYTLRRRLIHTRKSLLEKWRSWANRRPYVHTHFVWVNEEVGSTTWYNHAHLFPQMYHEHEIDLPCVMPGCDPFPRHRLHPQPGPKRAPR